MATELMSKVRFDRADINSAIEAARRLKPDRDLYIFATYLGYTIDSRQPPGMQAYVIVHPDGTTETIKPSVGGNPVSERTKHYHGPYLANWQYGGYSYIEEDPTKPESLWPHGMVDYADPEEVIAIAEKEGLPTISLAGGFWERIGYKGWGEKLSISESRTALAKAREHILGRSTSSEQHSNPGGEQVTGKIDKLRSELEGLRDEAFNRHRGVVLSDWVTSPDSPGIVINEERAKATPCKCFTYKGKDYCYSPGIIGMLEAGQVPAYCPTKEYEVRSGIKERFEEFAEAAEAAHERIEEIPKGERLIPWLTEMGKELRARGIEV